MAIHVPEHVMQQAGLTERQLLIEIACWLFAQGKVDLWPAAQMAGLTRVEMEAELLRRKIPLHTYSEEEYEQDLEYLARRGA